MRRKRSSSAAAMSAPSWIRQAEESAWKALMPRIQVMARRGIRRNPPSGSNKPSFDWPAPQILFFRRDHVLIGGFHHAQHESIHPVPESPAEKVAVNEIQRRPERQPRGHLLEGRPPPLPIPRYQARPVHSGPLPFEFIFGILHRVAVLPLEPLLDPLQVLVDEVMVQVRDLALHLLGFRVPVIGEADTIPADQADHPRWIQAGMAQPPAPHMEAAADPKGPDLRVCCREAGSELGHKLRRHPLIGVQYQHPFVLRLAMVQSPI